MNQNSQSTWINKWGLATGEGSRIKERVRRINAEVKKIPRAHIWVTEAKEVENYLSGSVLGKVFDLENISDPGKFEQFFPSESVEKKGSSFVESQLKRKSVDKMDLAVQAAPHITKQSMEARFDLIEQIDLIIERIRAWNS